MYSKEESKNIRLEFWNRFKDYSALRRRQKGKPAKWIMNNTGIKQLKLKFEFDENQAVVGIDIETRNTDKRIELYDKLEKLKKILEEKFKQPLIWELDYIQASGKSISRIYLMKEGVNIYNEESWPEVFYFFYKNMMKLEDFYEEFRDMLKY
jgi:hypothetical protein